MSPYYSQFGEDRFIVENLDPPERGVFVEVGADDGVENSNTLHFELEGWTGLCVEPNPEAMRQLRSARTCATEQCAIGSDPSRRYFVNPVKGWSGFDRGGKETVVSIRGLGDVLADHCIRHVDLLSIDCEGNDLDVLLTMDLAFHKPGIIIIEYLSATGGLECFQHLSGGPGEKEIVGYLEAQPYTLVHRTVGNLIFHRVND